MAIRSIALLVAVLFIVQPCCHINIGSEEGPTPSEVVTGEVPVDIRLEALAITSTGYFIENRGQLDDPRVSYYARGDPLSVAFGVDGALYSYEGPDGSFAFSMWLSGARQVHPVGVSALDGTSNYFIGQDPAGWVTGARFFKAVLYEEVLEGIDIRFYFSDGLLKYDLELDAGVDSDAISMYYDGLDGLDVHPVTGDLLLTSGGVTLRDARPVVIQEGLGPEGREPGAYRIHGDMTVGFVLPEGIDPTLPLTIDPGLEFSTLVGGIEKEMLTCCEVDPDGNIVIAGYADNT
ncbi:MAG: hypothetical protein JSW25_04625, partial [Thermoplasmata archaeon]